jgi:transposase
MFQETFEPGASVARVAQRHAINANQLLLWRKLYREGLLGCWEKTAIV